MQKNDPMDVGIEALRYYGITALRHYGISVARPRVMATRTRGKRNDFSKSIVLLQTASKEPRPSVPYLYKKDTRPHGTAVVVDSADFNMPDKQLLLTAYHCVEFAEHIWIRCPQTTKQLEAVLYYAAPHVDVALIRVEKHMPSWDSVFTPVVIDQNFPALGDPVHAVGYGGIGVRLSFTTGVVSGSTEFMTFTSEVNPGCSGGAVLRRVQARGDTEGARAMEDFAMVAVIHGYVQDRQSTNIGIPMEAVCASLRNRPQPEHAVISSKWVARPSIFGAGTWSCCSPKWVEHFNTEKHDVEGVLLHSRCSTDPDRQSGPTLDRLFGDTRSNAASTPTPSFLITKLVLPDESSPGAEKTFNVRCDGTVQSDRYDQFFPLSYVENMTRVGDHVTVYYYERPSAMPSGTQQVSDQKSMSLTVQGDPCAYRPYALEFEAPPYRMIGGMVVQIAHPALGSAYNMNWSLTSMKWRSTGVLVVTNVSASSPFHPSPETIEGMALLSVNGTPVNTIQELDDCLKVIRSASQAPSTTGGLSNEEQHALIVIACCDGTQVACEIESAAACDHTLSEQHGIPGECVPIASPADNET